MAETETMLLTRFVVARSTVIERDNEEYALVFLVPLAAKLEMEPPEENAEAEAQWEQELNNARADFGFTANQKDDSGRLWPRVGIEISTAKPLAVGTIVDFQLHIVA